MQKILEKMRNRAMSLVLMGALSSSAVVEAVGTLNIFQITQGYNDGPADVTFFVDNLEYFGFDFHNGKMAAVWMDNSGITTSTPPAPLPQFVFGSAQVNSPQDVVVGANVIVSKNLDLLQGEPALAIDRKNTNNMFLLGYNQHPETPPYYTVLSQGMLIASTNDAGKNWKTNFALQKNNFLPDSITPIPLGINNGDVQTRYDSFGNLYFTYFTTTISPSLFFVESRQFPNYMNLCVSTDHGKSFKVLYHADPTTLNDTATSYDFPLLAVGQDQVAMAGTFYSTNFSAPDGAQLFIIPVKGKGKFGSPTQIAFPKGSLFVNGDGYGTMAFSPSGGLLIAQTLGGGANLDLTQSCDTIWTSFLPKGSKAFPAETEVQPFRQVGIGWSAYPPQPYRHTWTSPHLDYVYNGHHYSRVYMVYIDNSNVPEGSCNYGGNTFFSSLPACPGFPFASPPCSQFPGWADTNVYVVYSDNDGATWSVPYTVFLKRTQIPVLCLELPSIKQQAISVWLGWMPSMILRTSRCKSLPL